MSITQLIFDYPRVFKEVQKLVNEDRGLYLDDAHLKPNYSVNSRTRQSSVVQPPRTSRV